MTTSQERPLNILHVIASAKWTGAAEPMGHLARAQMEAGHNVVCATTTGKSLEKELESLGLRVERSVNFTDNAYGPRAMRDLMVLRRVIMNESIDVVHSHMTRDHIAAALAMRVLPTKSRPVLVRSVHREIKMRDDIFTRFFQTGPTAGFTTPSMTQRGNIAANWRVEESRVMIWRAEVDTDRFQPDPGAGLRFRDKFNIPREATVLGYVGRLRNARGVDWLIDAAEVALRQNPDLIVMLAGRGSGLEEIQAHIARCSQRDRIRHVGYITGEDLEGGYNALDCALLMKPGSDGACRGAVQAMACGKPVIAGDIGALRDLFGDGKAGWAVPVDDVDALSKTMLAAAADPEARQTRGAEGMRIARERHPLHSQCARFIDFYRDLAARRAS